MSASPPFSCAIDVTRFTIIKILLRNMNRDAGYNKRKNHYPAEKLALCHYRRIRSLCRPMSCQHFISRNETTIRTRFLSTPLPMPMIPSSSVLMKKILKIFFIKTLDEEDLQDLELED